MNKKILYVEPAGYFPKKIRKETKIGEYAEKQQTNKSRQIKL